MDTSFLDWLGQEHIRLSKDAERTKEAFFRMAGAVQMIEHIQGHLSAAATPPIAASRPARKRKGAQHVR